MKPPYPRQHNSRGIDTAAIIRRIGYIVHADTDETIARAIGCARTTVTAWRSRKSIPYTACATIAKNQRVSLDWLIFGPRYGLQHSAAPAKPHYRLINGIPVLQSHATH